MSRRRYFGLAALGALLLGIAPAAWGDAGPGVHIRQATLDTKGGVRLVVSVDGGATSGVLGASAFGVTEAGKSVTGLAVTPLLAAANEPVAVAILIDDSGSTAGTPHADAQAAARAFVQQAPDGVEMGLFAFDAKATQKLGFTSDRTALNQAINALPVGGETALYDAVSLAASALGSIPGQRNIVLFTDGRDTVSHASLAAATAAAKSAGAAIYAVGLKTPDLDPAVLAGLAGATGGSDVSVSGSGNLSQAFGHVAQQIASQYVITYTSTATAPKDLTLTVSVTLGGTPQTDSITLSNPRFTDPGPAQPAAGQTDQAPAPPIPVAPVRALGSTMGLYVGAGAVFLALALILGTLAWRPGGQALKLVRRSLRLATQQAGTPADAPSGASALARRAAEIVDQAPVPKAYSERLQTQLERAGWPMRSSEFLVLQAAGAAAGILTGLGLLGHWYIAVLLAIVGSIVPRVVLDAKVRARAATFLAQLPDTLQLLSASLRAGYGLLQAVDTVTKEAPSPTSTEFSRVLTEARLGMPIEDALEAMAERVGGVDFRWVVQAINIHRQVGGNLAQVLETVATTLRERESLRRHVKALSAEGRLSAVILAVLPFLLTAYMLLVNPSYLATLISVWYGDVMIAGGVILVGVGIAWMRKMVRIEI